MIIGYQLCKISRKEKIGGSFFYPKYEEKVKFSYIKIYNSDNEPEFIYEDEDGRDWFNDYIERRMERVRIEQLEYYKENRIKPDFIDFCLPEIDRERLSRERINARHEFYDTDKRIKGNLKENLNKLSFKAPRLGDEEKADKLVTNYKFIDTGKFFYNFESTIPDLDTKEIKDMMSDIKTGRIYVSGDLASRKESREIWNKVYDMLNKESIRRAEAVEEKECSGNARLIRDLRKAETAIKKESLKKVKLSRENSGETDADKSNDAGVYGNRGEENVDYVIKWLGKEYKSIEKNCPSRFVKGKLCIRLKNKELIDEEQEFDHIIVSSSGVFMIETKFYKGKIIINKNQLWTRITDKNEEGMENPEFQVNRHHKVLTSILNGLVDEEDIHDIICIAHNNAIIEGVENSPVPIVKYDVLENKIRSIAGAEKNKYDTDEIINRINQFKVFDFSNTEIENRNEE